METLNYTSQFINARYLMRVQGINEEGKKFNTLVGVSGLVRLLGVEFANKFIERAERCLDDKCVCKLRGRYIVTFMVH